MIEIFFYTFVLFTREIVTKDGGKGGGAKFGETGNFWRGLGIIRQKIGTNLWKCRVCGVFPPPATAAQTDWRQPGPRYHGVS